MKPDYQGNPNCKHCGFTYYNNPAPTAGVFIKKNDQVLMAIRGEEPFKGRLDTIGGFVDAGENLEQAAIREVKEETGLDVKLLTLLGSYPDVYGDGIPILGFVFVGEITGNEANMQPMDDVSELKWYKISELPAADIAFKNGQQAARDFQLWYKQLPN